MVITPVFETGIQGSIPCKNICEFDIISVSSVGRASVLWAEGLGFEPQIENNLVSFKVKHLLLRAGEVSSTLTSDIGSTELSQLV